MWQCLTTIRQPYFFEWCQKALSMSEKKRRWPLPVGIVEDRINGIRNHRPHLKKKNTDQIKGSDRDELQYIHE